MKRRTKAASVVAAAHVPGRAFFGDEVRVVVQRLRAALADICAAIPGGPIERASQLTAALNIDEGLAWKLMKVINAADPFEATSYVPGQSGAEIFLSAARQKRIATDAVARAGDAFDEFRRLVSDHGGDRRSFDMLAAGQVQRDRIRADYTHRRGAYQHVSYLLGFQAQADARAYILKASESGDAYDVISVRTAVNVRRIRESIDWRVSRMYVTSDSGELIDTPDRVPLDREAAGDPEHAGLPLIRKFCSTPLPKFRRVSLARGFDHYLLSDDRIGKQGEFTCVIGELMRRAESRYQTRDHRELRMTSNVRTPCELLVMDVLIHRELFGACQFSTAMYSDTFVWYPGEPFRPWDRMPMHEAIERLGRGPSVAFRREVPHYPELLSYAMKQAGWNGDDFDVYRLALEYPPVPTTLVVECPLPERP